MKIKIAALALLTSVAMFCSESNGDLLGRMLGRGGCGECQSAPSCCDTPAPACGRSFSMSINIGVPCRLFKRCGGGCGMLGGGGLFPSNQCNGCDTGCDSGCGGEVIVDDGCGCRGGRVRGMFSRMFSGGCGDSCGCEPAPVECGPTCGCDDPCDSGCGGLLSGGLFSGKLFSRFGGGGCGCETACEAPAPCMAPAPSCGCDNAPACGCGLNLRGRVSGMFNRGNTCCDTCGSEDACGCDSRRAPVRTLMARIPRPFAGGCGCDDAGNGGCAAPVAAPSCGCDDAPNCGCGRRAPVRSLVSRIPRPLKNCRCGASDCDGGCGVSDCGCSSKPALLDRLRGSRGCGCESTCENSGCTNCGNMVPGDNMMNPAPTQAPIMAVPDSTEGSVIVPQADGASRAPLVDPSAFVIRGN